jgi:hypothetical protein
MKMLRYTIAVAMLVGALVLAACGGGENGSVGQDRQAGQGIAVGEPNGGAPVTSEFVGMAQAERCADVRNRLFVIDQKQVFWDRAGNCADNSHAQRLFGPTPQSVLCESIDTIAGPKTFCADEKSRVLFETILNNLDKPDLGLGAGHKVEPLPFLPKAGTPIAFEPVSNDVFSGVTVARTVVIKDAASWGTLWAEHSRNRVPAPEVPKIDFGKQMLLGVFSGQHAEGCRAISIIRVGAGNGKMVVEYDDRALATLAPCAAAVSAPMHVVAVERNDAPVEFVPVKPGALAFTTVDLTSRSGVRAARTVTVRDGDAWSALWAEHSGSDAPPPVLDFSKKMVVAVFLGTQENGCYSTSISSIYRDANKITVLHVDSVPGKGVLCTLALTSPAHLAVIERSDTPVEFATQISTLL